MLFVFVFLTVFVIVFQLVRGHVSLSLSFETLFDGLNISQGSPARFTSYLGQKLYILYILKLYIGHEFPVNIA